MPNQGIIIFSFDHVVKDFPFFLLPECQWSCTSPGLYWERQSILFGTAREDREFVKNPLQDGWCFTKGACQQNHLSVPSDIVDFLVTLVLQKYQDCREESLGDRTRCWIFLVVFWFGGGQEGCFLVFCLFALFVGFVLFFSIQLLSCNLFSALISEGAREFKKKQNKTQNSTTGK